MHHIFQIDASRRTPKYLQLVHCITKAIKNGSLKNNDRIPSINELSNEFLLSRHTVQKAYSLLIETGIIVPIQGKGFYINRTDIATPYRILLVINKISNYKKQVYNSFIQTLGNKAIVELKVHHSNVSLLDEFVTGQSKEFDYILIMPHFYENEEKAMEIIKKIPKDKLILLDKEIPGLESFASVYQDFKNDISEALESALPQLMKYQELVLVFPHIVNYPTEIVAGFRKFCLQQKFKSQIIPEIENTLQLTKGSVYIVIEEMDLVNIIKLAKVKGLQQGNDFGIISFNDTPLKEILLDGITVISTDHEKMGEMAANLILGNTREKIKNPFNLILRNSL
ncbi:MAG: GntR family transcriptional regulator [Chitinophagaceae bacterium]